MRISALTIRDFKGIREVSLDTDRELILVAGKNGAGKSSALDAITVLLMGKDAMPAEPIRRGSDSGEIVAKLDGFTVRRTFTRKDDGTFGGSLTITSPDGAKYPSPQGWLDARINALGCDPIAFMASKPSEQAETLRKIAGVDTTALDATKKAAFDSRTEIGRVGKDDAGALANLPKYDDAPPEIVEPAVVTPSLVSASDIVAELAAADATAQARRDADRMVDDLTGAATRKLVERDRLNGEAEALRQRVREIEAAALLAAEECARQTAAAANAAERALSIAVTDRATIAARLSAVEQTNAEAITAANEANAANRRAAEATNAKVRANAVHKAQAEKVAAGRKAYAAKTAEIDALESERVAMLAAAKFPVPGLGFGAEGGVTFDGIPLAQANEATKIRVSMAIALAGDKPGKIVLIRNGSQLDEDSMALVADLAHTAGAQLFIERVGVGDVGAVVISDGGVA